MSWLFYENNNNLWMIFKKMWIKWFNAFLSIQFGFQSSDVGLRFRTIHEPQYFITSKFMHAYSYYMHSYIWGKVNAAFLLYEHTKHPMHKSAKKLGFAELRNTSNLLIFKTSGIPKLQEIFLKLKISIVTHRFQHHYFLRY